MHTDDAAARGIRTGDSVRLFNSRGEIPTARRSGRECAMGVVRAPAVRWAKTSAAGRSANALTSDRLTDIGGGPVFYSCLVQIEKCGD